MTTPSTPGPTPGPSSDLDRGAAADRPASIRPVLRLIPGTRDPEPEQLALALDWEVGPGIPSVPPVPRRLRVIASTPDDIPTATPPPGPDAADPSAPRLPDPGKWTARLARAVAEVAVGERPPGQLTRWVSRGELAKLAHRGTYVGRHPSARAQRGVTRIRSVRAVRVCPVAPGIVETSAVLVGSERAQAVAIRLEAVGDRWLATAVELR